MSYVPPLRSGLSTDQEYLRSVEHFAGKQFRHTTRILSLLGCARIPAQSQRVGEILFLSKFVTGSWKILNRSGIGNPDVGRLSSEFSAAVSRISELIQELSGSIPEHDRMQFEGLIPPLSPLQMGELLAFAEELAWFKSFEIDQPNG
jgi:hypothetical protein